MGKLGWVVLLAFLIGSLVRASEAPGHYLITAIQNDGTVYSDIRSPAIASSSTNGEQYVYFWDHSGQIHFVELCEDEPTCIGMDGIRLQLLSPGK